MLTVEAWVVHELIDYEGVSGPVHLPFVLALYGFALYGLGTALQPWLDRVALRLSCDNQSRLRSTK